MIPKPLGDQELALMQWLADRGGATVGEAAEEYGLPRGLARSTVLTMMERLRAKGHLDREPVEGVFRYQSSASSAELLRGVVAGFVERTLGGSLSPFVTYLTETPVEVSASELVELEALVARLQARRGEGEP